MDSGQAAPDQPPGSDMAFNIAPSSAANTPFKVDEGYSEDARSLDDGDSTMGVEPRFPPQAPLVDPMQAMYRVVLSLDESQRTEYVYNVLRTLRTSSIAAIVERLTPLLHLDPVAKLPPDITSLLFSHLEPTSLLQASRVSKAWRERTLDTLLWREQFRREGWTLDMEEVRRFERSYKPAKALSRKATDDSQRQSKRTARDADFARSSLGGMSSGDGTQDQEMQDIGQASTEEWTAPSFERMDTGGSARSRGSMSPQVSQSESAVAEELLSPHEVPRDPPVLTRSYSGGARVNFHHVYKQKRRLEDNWSKGRFKSFQLPHRNHPEEAHSECVYTIQYAGKYLVSGSRDRTLRIWNLDTQRLIRRPLEGHKGSVLCLQFDASQAEDIIISGSSDTDVILWQFSTGKMLKRIQSAHRESVLNLKFDRRFLVTCSKDKMIKIWNRRALLPGDVDYPRKGVAGGGRCPSYVIDWASLPSPLELERMTDQGQLEAIPEYSLIMKIDDHGAAVNAVHIYHDQLVSASGDRALRVFDIHSGVRIATCKGHTKGIACVQYDGKRIVSGSSDNTIRIFDPKSQAEVACLLGHKKLVRTVQASFGDVPGTEGELEAEARAADRAFLRSEIATKSPSLRPHRGERRNVDEIKALGAKLPPGGGGSPWARIVSGSYDESIIIWKKRADGRWEIAYTLQQAEALQAAGEPLIAQSERQPASRRVPQALGVPQQQQFQQQQPQVPNGPGAAGGAATATGIASMGQLQQPQSTVASTQSTQTASQFASQTQLSSQAQPTIASSSTHAPSHPLLQHTSLTHQAPTFNWPPQTQGTAAAHAATENASQSQSPTSAQPPTHVFTAAPSANAQSTIPILHSTSPSSAAVAMPGLASNPVGATAAHHVPALQGVISNSALDLYGGAMMHGQPHAQAGHGIVPVAQGQFAQALHPAQAPQHPNARVFKLQFDARRIICCSQDPKIVGWDFANSDPEIEEAAGFFGGPA